MDPKKTDNRISKNKDGTLKSESPLVSLVIGIGITVAFHIAVSLGLGMLWNSVVHRVLGGVYLSSLDAVLLWTLIMIAIAVSITMAAKIWSRVNVLSLDVNVTLPPPPDLLKSYPLSADVEEKEVRRNEPPTKQFPQGE